MRHRIAKLRSISLLLLRCILSILAVIFPFYHIQSQRVSIDYARDFSEYFWSFKFFNEKHESNLDWIIRTHTSGNILSYLTDSIVAATSPCIYLNAYWFSSSVIGRWTPVLSWVLITMFAAQVSTLASGLGSIVLRKQIVEFVTVEVGAATIALMIYSSTNLYWPYGSFQLGFLFSCLAEIAFVVNLTSRAWNTRAR